MELINFRSAVMPKYDQNKNIVQKQSNSIDLNKTFNNFSYSYGKDLINFRGLSKINLMPFEKRSLNDQMYIKNLANSLNCSCKQLSAVMGLDELKSILKKSSITNYTPSSPLYMINLHTHTLNSDGKATVQEILDEAEARGKKSGNNFLISITDHDTIKTSEEALRLISSAPENYKHIRFVPGIEPCFYYDNKNILKKPIPFDAIIYCVNPFDKDIKHFFENISLKNKSFAKEIIDSANKKWDLSASFEDAINFHPLIKTGGSSGFLKFTKKYIEACLKEKNISYTDNEVLDIFNPYYLNQNGRVTKATANIEDVLSLFSKHPEANIGIAHPCIVEINPKQDATLDFASNVNLQNGHTYNEALLDFVNNCRLKTIELHYQYDTETTNKYPQIKTLYEILNKQLGDDYFRTGGTDSHGNTLGQILSKRK